MSALRISQSDAKVAIFNDIATAFEHYLTCTRPSTHVYASFNS